MPLKQRLTDDLRTAMRNRDVARRSTLRYLLSEIHNQEIAAQAELDEEATTQVLTKQAQQRRDSMAAFEQGGREDLVAKEKGELEIIMEYLPAQMTRDEIVSLAQSAVQSAAASGPQDMGKVMSLLMPQVRGRAEGREVSSIVSELLRNIGS